MISFVFSIRSELSQPKTEGQHSFDEQPCFPTHNDRISFINQSSIGDRCVRFEIKFQFNFYIFNQIENLTKLFK
jgi:hypothetical protein